MSRKDNKSQGNEFEQTNAELMDLTKRRFFYRQAFDIYGGVAGFYTYGPPGSAVKTNLINLWRKHFVIEDNLQEIEDTNIMPHAVLKASGHVERFNDFMVQDAKDSGKFFRADKILEDHMEKMLADPKCDESRRDEYIKVKAQADAYSKDELHEVLQKYGVKAPESGNDITAPYEFNLMFPTPIGPAGLIQGYLRPETAQGIFLNYKYCAEQNANAMPFGVAQVGKAFRNEIAPRGGLIRQREFTQAEIEFFVKPGVEKPHKKFHLVENLDLPLFSADLQMNAKAPESVKLGDAVKKGLVANETLGYFIGRTYQFLVRAGVRPAHIRFRQHLASEMAHYACDCWDAEIEMSQGWVECVGIADRACYDLTQHSKATKVDMNAREKLETPITQTVFGITKKAQALLGKEFKKEAGVVKEFLTSKCESAPDEVLKLAEAAKASGSTSVDIDGKSFTLKAEHLATETKQETKHEEVYTPGVVEPSFGIDRILCAIFEHAYFARPAKEEEGGKKGDKMVNGVLSFKPEVAPYKAAVFPVDNRVLEKCGDVMEKLRVSLTEVGVQYKIDTAGVSIGRRYARADELGIPFAITIDAETLDPSNGTATVRERDSTLQVRVPVPEIAGVIHKLSLGTLLWDELKTKYAGAGSADGKQSLATYLAEQKVTEKLNEVLNKMAHQKPENAILFIAEELKKLESGEGESKTEKKTVLGGNGIVMDADDVKLDGGDATMDDFMDAFA